MTDSDYMQLAIGLAKQGIGKVNPNPLVGAVIVKNGRIIGRGCHLRYGDAHAEINALAELTEAADGATLYVTLEPCSHYGKTPPCVLAVIGSGIKRVVTGSRDPNPLVAGKGIQCLKDHGIQVTEDVEYQDCINLNQVYFHYIRTNTPYVIMKYAMTTDGKIATVTGQSRWITGPAAREHVHQMRNQYAAIMVGAQTVLSDDPMLTCRIPGGRNPLRIVCDSWLRIPADAAIIRTADTIPTVIATCCTDNEKQKTYRQAGCEIITTAPDNGRVNLKRLMAELAARKIDSVYLEGGAALNWSAITSGIVCKVQTYIAPKIFGGLQAAGPVSGAGVELPDQAFALTAPEIRQLDQDILLESEVILCSPD